MSYKDDAARSRKEKLKRYADGGSVGDSIVPDDRSDDRTMGLQWMKDEVGQRERQWKKSPPEFDEMNRNMEMNQIVPKRTGKEEQDT